MPKKSLVLLPETERILEQMGQQIKYARLRRKLPAELVAERATPENGMRHVDNLKKGSECE